GGGRQRQGAGAASETDSLAAAEGRLDRSVNPRTLAGPSADRAIQEQREILSQLRVSELGRPENVLARAWDQYERTRKDVDLAWLIAVDERVNNRVLPESFKTRKAGENFLSRHGLAEHYEVFQDRDGRFRPIRQREPAADKAAGLLGAVWNRLQREGYAARYVDSYSEAYERNQPLMDEPNINGVKVRQLSDEGLVIERQEEASNVPSTGESLERDRGQRGAGEPRSEEHTSELQSRENLVCR